MNHVARFVLGAVVVGFAATVGCVFSPFYSSEGSGGQAGTTTGTGGSIPCSSAGTCEDVDKNPCTQEACMNDVCIVTPLTMDKGPGSTECKTIACQNGVSATTIHSGSACGMDLTCTAQGVCSGCTTNEKCGKTDECQTSICQSDMTCEYTFKALGTPVNAKLPTDMPGDCMATICNGAGMIVLSIDDMDVPDDGVMCTDGRCTKGTPGQSVSAIGTPCANGTTFCNAFQSCVPCTENAGCVAGMTCAQEKECVGCADGKKNQNETDTDCGGVCGSTCLDGQECKVKEDCKSGLCSSGTCISCSDNVKNGDEVGVDCGGPCAKKCEKGTPCSNPADCVDNQCVDGVCCATACTDDCTACNIPATLGTCSQLAKGHDDSSPVCSDTKTCDNGSCVGDMGKNHFGEDCSGAAQCFSGICAGMPGKCN